MLVYHYKMFVQKDFYVVMRKCSTFDYTVQSIKKGDN